MRIRTWLTLFFLPLFAGGTAYAFFDISAPFQRALMIANQATLIANQGGATGNHESAARQADRAVHPHQGFHLGAGGSDHPTVHRSGFGARPAHRHRHVLEIRFYQRSR